MTGALAPQWPAAWGVRGGQHSLPHPPTPLHRPDAFNVQRQSWSCDQSTWSPLACLGGVRSAQVEARARASQSSAPSRGAQPAGSPTRPHKQAPASPASRKGSNRPTCLMEGHPNQTGPRGQGARVSGGRGVPYPYIPIPLSMPTFKKGKANESHPPNHIGPPPPRSLPIPFSHEGIQLETSRCAGAMRQRIMGSHTPPCHRRMVITTQFSVLPCCTAAQTSSVPLCFGLGHLYIWVSSHPPPSHIAG